MGICSAAMWAEVTRHPGEPNAPSTLRLSAPREDKPRRDLPERDEHMDHGSVGPLLGWACAVRASWLASRGKPLRLGQIDHEADFPVKCAVRSEWCWTSQFPLHQLGECVKRSGPEPASAASRRQARNAWRNPPVHRLPQPPLRPAAPGGPPQASEAHICDKFTPLPGCNCGSRHRHVSDMRSKHEGAGPPATLLPRPH